jgi:predicted O-linked N-acetylglucosamine transferase (SPINDLY family)
LQARALRVNAGMQLARWQEAINDLQILIAAMPQQAQLHRMLALCWLRIGNAHREAGDRSAATLAYEHALLAQADQIDARYNLALVLLEQNYLARPIELLRDVLRSETDNHAARVHLARALIASEQVGEACDLLMEAAGATQQPDLLAYIATQWVAADAHDAALALGKEIYRDGRQSAAQGWQLAAELRQHGHLDQANELLDLLTAARPTPGMRLRIDLARRLGLPIVYSSGDELERARAEYGHGLRRVVEEYPPHILLERRIDPQMLLWENFYLAYQGHDDLSLQETFGRWLSNGLAALLPQPIVAARSAARARPRLVLVSSSLRDCTVGAYFFSWVQFLHRNGWELLLVQLGGIDDALTRRFAAHATALLKFDGRLAEVAGRLRQLDADILLYPEIGMDAQIFALAALRLAPVQVCAWGHPTTTGLPTIDAFFSCTQMEPPDAQRHYSEKLIGLPRLGTRYLSPEIPPASARADLGLPIDRNLYLVPQSPFKLHPDNDRVLAGVLERDPSAVFVLFDGQKRGMLPLLRARIERALAKVSDQPARHLHIVAQGDRAHYLRINQACDVMLDSVHWSGGNTSLDALHCGLPLVTFPGAMMRGRQSMAMLAELGCEELIADNPDALAAHAVTLAQDRLKRNALSRRIVSALPQLTASDEPLQQLNAHLRALLTHRPPSTA